MKPPQSPIFHLVPACASAHIDRQALMAGFRAQKNAADVRRTHLINGRYENIYLTTREIPTLAPLLEFAEQQANTCLKQQARIDKIGYWFNAMEPGSRTSKHDHHDGNELLSGVFYVDLPNNSGDLLLYGDSRVERHCPRAGELLLFSPSVPHEVTENLSRKLRLSIGMNFLAAR